MATEFELETILDQTIKHVNAEQRALEKQLHETADHALMDWLLVAACADYDTIELDPQITGKAERKQYKVLREQKRNLEKQLEALKALRETVTASEGEKLRKKFETEVEKYQV